MKYLYSIVGVCNDRVVYDEKEVVGAPKSHKRALEYRLKQRNNGQDVHLVYTKLAEITTTVKPTQ
ncbi:MAG: hypothetical protein ACWGQW_02980 [bacterium]